MNLALENTKLGSIIDYPRDQLDQSIWDISGDEIQLQPEIKKEIMDIVYSALDDLDLPYDALKNVFIYGSILTNQYNKNTDVDARIVLEPKPTQARFGDDITGDTLYDLVVDVVHGVNLGDTKHPFNATIIIEDEDTELGQSPLGKTEKDPVYDVIKDEMVVEPVFEDFYVPEDKYKSERGDVEGIMEGIDDVLRELTTDVIDYQWLQDAVKDVKDPTQLEKALEDKIKEIEDSLEKAVDEYQDVKEMRKTDYGTDEDRHGGEGNVKFKFLEKYKYLDVLKKLKRIFKDKKVTDKEIDDMEQMLTYSGNIKKAIKLLERN